MDIIRAQKYLVVSLSLLIQGEIPRGIGFISSYWWRKTRYDLINS